MAKDIIYEPEYMAEPCLCCGERKLLDSGPLGVNCFSEKCREESRATARRLVLEFDRREAIRTLGPEVAERLDVVRRSLERGKRLAEYRVLPITGNTGDKCYIDIFVHCLDELVLLKKALSP